MNKYTGRIMTHQKHPSAAGSTAWNSNGKKILFNVIISRRYRRWCIKSLPFRCTFVCEMFCCRHRRRFCRSFKLISKNQLRCARKHFQCHRKRVQLKVTRIFHFCSRGIAKPKSFCAFYFLSDEMLFHFGPLNHRQLDEYFMYAFLWILLSGCKSIFGCRIGSALVAPATILPSRYGWMEVLVFSSWNCLLRSYALPSSQSHTTKSGGVGGGGNCITALLSIHFPATHINRGKKNSVYAFTIRVEQASWAVEQNETANETVEKLQRNRGRRVCVCNNKKSIIFIAIAPFALSK